MFYENGPGVLIHPIWQTSSAYFTELQLRQEPRPDYVAYRFEFREDAVQTGGLKPVTAASAQIPEAVYHTVRTGESFWQIAARYDMDYEQLAALNPQLRNPNLLLEGERVRIA